MIRREEILTKVSNIVAVPSCAQKAMAMIEHPDDNKEKLARVIEHDPGLTANLLKIVNVSNINGSEPMLTARQAIDRLGTQQVLQFVISTGVAPSYVQKIEGYDLSPSMHLQHSVTVGMAARRLGNMLGLDVPDYVFTAGLLSGIGKILLGAYVKVSAAPIMDLAIKDGLSFDKAEDLVLGVNHAEVGGLLLDSWGLPQEITDVVRYHLDPDMCSRENVVLDLVHIGNVLAKMIGLGLGSDGLNYTVSEKVVERLGLTSEILDLVTAMVVDEIYEVWDLFVECAEE